MKEENQKTKVVVKKGQDKMIQDFYMNREHSWLLFDHRVLDQANDVQNPLLERCKFLSIFCSNLDEFFMVRVGSLMNQAEVDPDGRENKTGLTASEQLKGILNEVKTFYRDRGDCFRALRKELESEKIKIMRAKDLSKCQKEDAKSYFVRSVLPLLSPMVLDAKHPMVRFENKQLYRVYQLKKEDRIMFGILPVSPKLERIYKLERSKQVLLLPLEELIKMFGDELFSGYEILAKSFVRVTRNADFDASVDDADVERDFDFSKFLKEKVETRASQGPVRLETDAGSEWILSFLMKNVGIKKTYCYRITDCFDYKFLMGLSDYLPQDMASKLKYKPFRGSVPLALASEESLISAVGKKDIFLFYPYHTMDTLIRLINECAADERVVSIKITIYRLAGHSKLVEALKHASENGKDVTVLIELCARFDEENNLYFAGVLQEAGCTIIYGMQNYKVHSKILSIIMSEGGELRYITHLGTGNYNEGTSRQYTDLNVITTDEVIGQDATAFFRNMSICNVDYNYQKLLIAPTNLKTDLLACMDEQIALAKAGKPARIAAKMNSLTDKAMIDKLAEAGMAGVTVEMVIRGICCLVPGIPGKTEHIRVVSVVGRFLEHSRIYSFGVGEERKLFISSADLMTRNISRRVEIATPIEDKQIADTIDHILHTILSDNVKARELGADGVYRPVENDEPKLDSQDFFFRDIH